MKLYEAPKNSRIRIVDEHITVEQRYKEPYIQPEHNEELVFKKLDGMYSICYNTRNEMVRLAAWTAVEVVARLEQQGQ